MLRKYALLENLYVYHVIITVHVHEPHLHNFVHTDICIYTYIHIYISHIYICVYTVIYIYYRYIRYIRYNQLYIPTYIYIEIEINNII